MSLELLSTNMKTRYSINFPIHETCNPTSICKRVCYAKKRRLAAPLSITRQYRILTFFLDNEPPEIANKIAEEYYKKHLSFLRWCGSGDLIIQAVDVLNILSIEYPDTVHWIVSRKPDMVAQLNEHYNFYIMFSLDGSDESKERKQIVDTIDNKRIYYSYLRQEANEDIMNASIIYNLQQNKKNLPFDNKRKCCPVDAGKLSILDACNNCKKCFTNTVYYKD